MTVYEGKPRRLAAVPVSGELLQQFFTEGWSPGPGRTIRCAKGLPPGAKPAFEMYDYAHPGAPVISFVFEHESFDLVHEGEEIPLLDVVFQEQADD